VRVLPIIAIVLTVGCATTQSSVNEWHEIGGVWKFEAGEWQPGHTEGMSFLVSKTLYSDVRVEVEFLPDAEVNSGVFVRCQNPDDVNQLNCFEANIWDNHPRQEFRTGSIVAKVAPPLAHVDTIGRWSTMRVEAVGKLVRVHVNGVLTASLESDEFLEGYVALQWGGAGSIRFRNLSVERI
jgi:hypothetical protein